MRIEIQWNSLFPLSMPYVTTLQYREIFWQNGSLLYGSDTAKQFFMRLQLRLQSLHKHDFISNQLLFYCWLTQQHFNFSVSFSFKMKLFKCDNLSVECNGWKGARDGDNFCCPIIFGLTTFLRLIKGKVQAIFTSTLMTRAIKYQQNSENVMKIWQRIREL